MQCKLPGHKKEISTLDTSYNIDKHRKHYAK